LLPHLLNGGKRHEILARKELGLDFPGDDHAAQS
jgi:hypothetical protein